MIPAEHVRFAGVVVAALFAGYGILRYRRGGIPPMLPAQICPGI